MTISTTSSTVAPQSVAPPSVTPPSGASPTIKPTQREQPARFKGKNTLLHYAAYFLGIGSLVFIAQTDEPKQIETALLAGAISAGSVLSRDWYKARLDPSMAHDPSALIGLFNEMLHAGRSQVNTNAAHLKRVEFLQTDLVEAMREFNDMLRLSPEDVEQKLRALQSSHLTSALPLNNTHPTPTQTPLNNSVNNNATEFIPGLGTTYVPPADTLRQSVSQGRPGFDA